MKPNILLTNDDGITSPGLKQLWESLYTSSNISIVAPAYDQSGVGLGVTLRNPLQIDKFKWEEETAAWKVTGTPADCVKLALGVLLKKQPDLIVSGINRGSNAGRTVLYSGTVGGTIEGAMRGIPGIAFSYENMENPDYSSIGEYILPIVKYVLENPLPPGTILNVNIPHVLEIKGIKFARQGRSYWLDNPDERMHPEGTPYFWLGGRWAQHEEFEDSDVYLLRDGYVSVVPLHVDELTDQRFLNLHREKFEKEIAHLLSYT
jgi:5'-nucleotidase